MRKPPALATDPSCPVVLDLSARCGRRLPPVRSSVIHQNSVGVARQAGHASTRIARRASLRGMPRRRAVTRASYVAGPPQ